MGKLVAMLDFVFGCHHSNLSRVFTFGGRTYRVCCGCGAKFEYSLAGMCIERRMRILDAEFLGCDKLQSRTLHFAGSGSRHVHCGEYRLQALFPGKSARLDQPSHERPSHSWRGFECNRDVSPTISHRSCTDSCPPRKLSALRGYFHLFALFDEKGNADFDACLELCCLGPAARRVATNRGFRVGDLQLNEYWQL